ncbi:MAG: response regulator [Rhodobiaceae bacterium]|nr:MAG: response regulator [Rhodobiaceae bacterium]
MSVLLVEDDRNVRATVKSMLREIGLQDIYTCSNGADALRFFEEESSEVRLIICDWNMPQKTGIEFLREIRQSHPELPFLLITARADQESVIAAKDAHVTDYLRKPFTLADLKSRVTHILSHMDDDLIGVTP